MTRITSADECRDKRLDAARRVIREHEQMQLSARDREAVVAALLNPPEPNAALTRAAREYNESVERQY